MFNKVWGAFSLLILMVQTFGCYHLAGGCRARVPLGRGGKAQFFQAGLGRPAKGDCGLGEVLGGVSKSGQPRNALPTGTALSSFLFPNAVGARRRPRNAARAPPPAFFLSHLGEDPGQGSRATARPPREPAAPAAASWGIPVSARGLGRRSSPAAAARTPRCLN